MTNKSTSEDPSRSKPMSEFYKEQRVKREQAIIQQAENEQAKKDKVMTLINKALNRELDDSKITQLRRFSYETLLSIQSDLINAIGIPDLNTLDTSIAERDETPQFKIEQFRKKREDSFDKIIDPFMDFITSVTITNEKAPDDTQQGGEGEVVSFKWSKKESEEVPANSKDIKNSETADKRGNSDAQKRHDLAAFVMTNTHKNRIDPSECNFDDNGELIVGDTYKYPVMAIDDSKNMIYELVLNIENIDSSRSRLAIRFTDSTKLMLFCSDLESMIDSSTSTTRRQVENWLALLPSESENQNDTLKTAGFDTETLSNKHLDRGLFMRLIRRLVDEKKTTEDSRSDLPPNFMDPQMIYPSFQIDSNTTVSNQEAYFVGISSCSSLPVNNSRSKVPYIDTNSYKSRFREAFQLYEKYVRLVNETQQLLKSNVKTTQKEPEKFFALGEKIIKFINDNIERLRTQELKSLNAISSLLLSNDSAQKISASATQSIPIGINQYESVKFSDLVEEANKQIGYIKSIIAQ